MTATHLAFGDSITFGTWLTDPASQSWPGRLDAMLTNGTVGNHGVGGMAVAYVDVDSPVRMDTHVLQQLAALAPADRPRVVMLAGGLNDMIRSSDVGPTRTAIYNLVNKITELYPSIKTFVHTVTPYASDAGYAEPLTQRRAQLNSWIRAMYGPAGRLIDTGDILTAGAYADPRFYLDQLHPNAEGAEQIALGAFRVLTIRGGL